MKETQAAVKALRSKAATYLQVAKVLESLDKVVKGFHPAKRHLSVAARRKIAMAQKQRWAKWHKANKSV